MRPLLIAAVLALSTLATVALATTDVLYDGSLGSTPDAQGWVYASFPLINGRATQTFEGGTTILDTTSAMSDMAGYFYTFQPPAPLLDRRIGFELSFNLRILEERHASRARAGFSLIVLSSDLKGVELAFWEDQIWAQSDQPLFTRGEGSHPFNTWSKLIRYALAIRGETYTLTADGRPIVSGTLKDYSAFNTPPFDFVYRQPNFLFFGDNTGSAAARIALASIMIGPPASAPLPSATTRGGSGR